MELGGKHLFSVKNTYPETSPSQNKAVTFVI